MSLPSPDLLTCSDAVRIQLARFLSRHPNRLIRRPSKNISDTFLPLSSDLSVFFPLLWYVCTSLRGQAGRLIIEDFWFPPLHNPMVHVTWIPTVRNPHSGCSVSFSFSFCFILLYFSPSSPFLPLLSFFFFKLWSRSVVLHYMCRVLCSWDKESLHAS